jgi:hypothetical protein
LEWGFNIPFARWVNYLSGNADYDATCAFFLLTKWFVESMEKPVAGAEIDGYGLIRPIGKGGFGTVWLCWSNASQNYHALKWIEGNATSMEMELADLDFAMGFSNSSLEGPTIGKLHVCDV